MKDIFICHAKDDKKSARALATKLENEKQISCIVSATEHPEKEPDMDVKVFVLILSEAARHSTDVMRLVNIALDKEIPIIPFKTAPVREDLGTSFMLHQLEWVDAHSDGFDTAVDLLVEIYSEHTNGEAPVKKVAKQKKSESQPMSKQTKYTLIAVGIALMVVMLWYFTSDKTKDENTTAQNNVAQTTTNTTQTITPYIAPEGSEPIIGTWKVIDYQDSRRMTPEEEAATQVNIEALKTNALVIFRADGTFARTGFTKQPQTGRWQFDKEKLLISLTPDGSSRPEQVNIMKAPDSTFTIIVNEKATTPSGGLEDVTTKITFGKQ